MGKCRYDSYGNIPARVFFEVKATRDYGKLRPKNGTTLAELEAIFAEIHEDWFRKEGNRDAEEFVNLFTLRAYYQTTIPMFRSLLDFLWSFPVNVWSMKPVRDQWVRMVDAINSHMPVKIDPNGELQEEFDKALNVGLGSMENDLNEVSMQLERMEKSGSVSGFEYDFHAELQWVNEWNAPQSTPSDCLLADFVASKQSAVRKAEKERIKQYTNGK